MTVRTTWLVTPPLPLVVDPRVFDGFAWQPSATLEWRAPSPTLAINALDGDLPLGLAFVFREPWTVLPMEIARLHIGRAYGLHDEMALAPYAIDDATDELFAHRRSASDLFWLAADNLNALFWGLHDWAHFHNHGAFTERAATELQCDVSALAWLWLNRASIPLPVDAWHTLREQVFAAHLKLRADDPPNVDADPAPIADAARLIAIADSLR